MPGGGSEGTSSGRGGISGGDCGSIVSGGVSGWVAMVAFLVVDIPTW
jgi:hypothetical protein